MVSCSLVLLIIGFLCVGYFYTLLLAGLGSRVSRTIRTPPKNTFFIAIAAHNESQVIAETICNIFEMNYPRNLYEVHVVADFCTDETSEKARAAGANVHVRNNGERGKKSAALSWLYEQIQKVHFDAFLILDADAKPDSEFLLAMNEALEEGHYIIQGQQRVSNPSASAYTAMASALGRIDNWVHNQGRCQLGGSARHMGDGICFKKSIVDKLGFGEGITEDHSLRHKILLSGYKIHYEPRAIAYNEAAQNWKDAKIQRTRWMQGTVEVENQHRWRLLLAGIRKKNKAIVEAAVESILPAYSTLASLSVLLFTTNLALFFARSNFSLSLTIGWIVLVGLVGIFPFVGLLISKAPLRDYFALLIGPFFLVWRTWLALSVRLFPKEGVWVRTPHGSKS